MHTTSLHLWQHEHLFGQDHIRSGERRTLWVLGLTGAMLAPEIGAGLVFGTMALLAEGLHKLAHKDGVLAEDPIRPTSKAATISETPPNAARAT